MKRAEYLRLWEKSGRRPLYLLDNQTLQENAEKFKHAFNDLLPQIGFYYAVKSNNNPEIAKTLLQTGFGLDVSSGKELQLALDLGADNIIFSGPGKTGHELQLALQHSDRVTLLMDSFGELARLEATADPDSRIRAGIRLTPPQGDAWRKFGIPLKRLREFWEKAANCRCCQLSGIQFHTSWNMDPGRQIETISAIGDEINQWPDSLAKQIEFLDIGGGIWPPRGEWLQPSALPEGKFQAIFEHQTPPWNIHYKNSSSPITAFADQLSNAIRKYIFPKVKCKICLEPGRWLCNDAMHLLLSVVDKKDVDLAITDAGTNTVGWERFEYYYAPILNLSNPEVREQKCHIMGSLCTPEDTWGYSFWGAEIQNDDVLLIPGQGAYTYSLRQEFIKPLPEVVIL